MTADLRSPSRARVHLALVANAVIWGAAYPAAKSALTCYPPPTALWLRFGLAALLVLPFAWRQLGDRRAARWGAVLGALMFAIYALLALGMRAMSPVRAAFIMGTTVVFVQAAETLARRRIEVGGSLGAAASLFGLYLLTGSGEGSFSAWDLVVLSAAALSALGLGVVHMATRSGRAAADAMTFWQLAVLAAIAGAWDLAQKSAPWRPSLWPTLSLVFCAVFASALAQRLQMLYQHHARPTVAAMIYALKPLFAAVTAALLTREMLGGRALAGATLMLAAAFLPPFFAWRRERRAQR